MHQDHSRHCSAKITSARFLLDERTALACSALLDREFAPVTGSVLPYLWHWLYFWPNARQSELGPDGHPRADTSFMPALLPRRMWAGSRLHFHAPVQIGEFLNHESSVKSLEEKNGRSGRLAFVTLSHRFVSEGGSLFIEEEQDIVYREPATGEPHGTAPTLARTDESWQQRIVPTEVMLFRYSALTFNAHRIHYDRSYAREQEGYPDLVVHGPLLATLLMESLCQNLPTTKVTTFSFKALSPVFVGQPFHVCGSVAATGLTADLWIRDQHGAVAMTATAGIAQ